MSYSVAGQVPRPNFRASSVERARFKNLAKVDFPFPEGPTTWIILELRREGLGPGPRGHDSPDWKVGTWMMDRLKGTHSDGVAGWLAHFQSVQQA